MAIEEPRLHWLFDHCMRSARGVHNGLPLFDELCHPGRLCEGPTMRDRSRESPRRQVHDETLDTFISERLAQADRKDRDQGKVSQAEETAQTQTRPSRRSEAEKGGAAGRIRTHGPLVRRRGRNHRVLEKSIACNACRIAAQPDAGTVSAQSRCPGHRRSRTRQDRTAHARRAMRDALPASVECSECSTTLTDRRSRRKRSRTWNGLRSAGDAGMVHGGLRRA